LRTLPLILSVSLLVGCNELAHVSQNATDIQTEAQALIDHGRGTGDKEVVERASRIHDLADDIHARVPNLENRTPLWLSTLWWVAVAVVLAAASVLLWQTGLGTAIRIAVGWIPRRKVQDADLMSKVLDPQDPEDARLYVATRRASDPEFDAAWRRLHSKETQCSVTSPPSSVASGSLASSVASALQPAGSSATSTARSSDA
jgi:hypothetical protein